MENKELQNFITQYIDSLSSNKAIESLENVLIEGEIIRAGSHLGHSQNLKASLKERLISNHDIINRKSITGVVSITYFNMKEDYEISAKRLNKQMKLLLIILLVLTAIGISLSILSSTLLLFMVPVSFALLFSIIGIFIYEKESAKLTALQRDLSSMQFYRAQLDFLESIEKEENKMKYIQMISEGIAEGRANKTNIYNLAEIRNQVNISKNLGNSKINN